MFRSLLRRPVWSSFSDVQHMHPSTVSKVTMAATRDVTWLDSSSLVRLGVDYIDDFNAAISTSSVGQLSRRSADCSPSSVNRARRVSRDEYRHAIRAVVVRPMTAVTLVDTGDIRFPIARPQSHQLVQVAAADTDEQTGGLITIQTRVRRGRYHLTDSLHAWKQEN